MQVNLMRMQAQRQNSPKFRGVPGNDDPFGSFDMFDSQSISRNKMNQTRKSAIDEIYELLKQNKISWPVAEDLIAAAKRTML